jgi:hypothetical protein
MAMAPAATTESLLLLLEGVVRCSYHVELRRISSLHALNLDMTIGYH